MLPQPGPSRRRRTSPASDSRARYALAWVSGSCLRLEGWQSGRIWIDLENGKLLRLIATVRRGPAVGSDNRRLSALQVNNRYVVLCGGRSSASNAAYIRIRTSRAPRMCSLAKLLASPASFFAIASMIERCSASTLSQRPESSKVDAGYRVSCADRRSTTSTRVSL